MPTIYYIRHGKTEWNALGRFQGLQDIPLNDLGRAEATKAGTFCASCLRVRIAIPSDWVSSRAHLSARALQWN